jgi:hypothetical protein
MLFILLLLLIPAHRRDFTRKQRSYLKISKLFVFTYRDLAPSCLVAALGSIPTTEAVLEAPCAASPNLDFIAAPISERVRFCVHSSMSYTDLSRRNLLV